MRRNVLAYRPYRLPHGLLLDSLPAFHAVRPDIEQMLRESVRGSKSRGGMQTVACSRREDVSVQVVLDASSAGHNESVKLRARIGQSEYGLQSRTRVRGLQRLNDWSQITK